jgi:hypothetical protein
MKKSVEKVPSGEKVPKHKGYATAISVLRFTKAFWRERCCSYIRMGAAGNVGRKSSAAHSRLGSQLAHTNDACRRDAMVRSERNFDEEYSAASLNTS